MKKANFKEFTIEVTRTGNNKASWSIDNSNYHLMTVTNNDTGKKVQFDFWASNSSPVLEDDYDIINAFYCFVGDALAGDMTYREFCNEFGYDEGSEEVDKVYAGCKEALEKLGYIYAEDIYDLSNELAEASYA